MPAQLSELEYMLRKDLCMEYNLHLQSYDCVPADHLKEGNKNLMALVKKVIW